MTDQAFGALDRRLRGLLPEPSSPRSDHVEELRKRLFQNKSRTATKAALSLPIRFTEVQVAPLGRIFIGFTDQGICYLTGAIQSEAELAVRIARRYGCTIIHDDSSRARWQRTLERWVQGLPAEESIDLSRLTPFERKVLSKAITIRRGEVRPYQWLAQAVGSPKASRAVGNAMARNPVPLLVPCHRVVAASGAIGNYSMGGVAVKRMLLQMEGINVDELATRVRRGNCG